MLTVTGRLADDLRRDVARRTNCRDAGQRAEAGAVPE